VTSSGEAPELVAIFADADAQRFVMRLIDAGMERGCLRRFVVEPVRDPMRDAHVARDPLSVAQSFLSNPNVRFLVLWDHHGSGREIDPPQDVERDITAAFLRAGVPAERVLAIAFVPELEIALEPVWDRVCEELAKKRKDPALEAVFDANDPKGALEAIARRHRIRLNPALFQELAGSLSIPKLKSRDPLARVGARLVEWFAPA
jgi:hypothetical protein